jgi:hypothetical protein
MNNLLSNIIAKQRQELPQILSFAPIKREKKAEFVAALDSSLIKVVIGPRRSGKSSLVHQSLAEKRYVYCNLEDEEINFDFKGEELIEIFDKQLPGYEYIFLDEIQLFPLWEKFVNRLQRLGKNIIITGSNATLLSTELASSLTGRYQQIELLPFSFNEFCSGRQLSQDSNAFLTYLKCGGFPLVVLNRAEHQIFLSSLWSGIILKDIAARYRIRKTPELNSLMYLILQLMACRTTQKALMRSMHGKLDATTISRFVSYAEAAYLCIALQNFSFKARQRINSEKKVYVYDNGFYIAHKTSGSSDLGKLLENQICIEAIRAGYVPNLNLFTYYTKNNLEVDFLLLKNGAPHLLLQVSLDVHSADTHSRELKALSYAGEELGVKLLYLVTINPVEKTIDHIDHDGKVIKVLPAWRVLEIL